MQADLIIKNAGQLVTCASPKPKRGVELSDVGIIAGGAVAVSGGKILAVGKSDDILREFLSEPSASADGQQIKIIDAEGKVVMPGFVDPHTHIVYAGDRLNEFELKIKGADYLEILTSGGGIISTVRNTRAASEDELVESALARLDKMMSCGTTTCEIKTGYGLDLETEMKMLRVIEELERRHAITIVPTLLAAHAVPPEFKDNVAAYVDLICDEIFPAAWKWYEGSGFFAEKIPIYCDVFTERNAYDVDQTKRLLETAAEFGFGIKAHVDQFTNLGGSRLGIELNAASIDHLDAISDEEIAMLAASETVGVVIPTENFSAGKTQFANARKLIDSGCAVALSTDYNPGSAPCPSVPMAMAIACRYQKLLPAEALSAATINAAYAIGMGERKGSLEPGKDADILILDAEDFRELVYEFGLCNYRMMISGGKVV